ncbi:MAG: efflux transporter outer membrane subunit [Rhodanobacteraceae bacterium]|nr:MAG: efflux transporter outer membrane subunit [Rhodanobacteraceae bacterium]
MLASCAVGPAYHKPAPPDVRGYTAAPLATTIPRARSTPGSVAGAQTLEPGATVKPGWWKGFGSPELDRLVAEALAHNPDLAAAQATLQTAQFELKAARGVFYPQVSLGLGGERTRTTGAAAGGNFGPQLYNLYTGQVSVSYYPDVFGLNRLVTRNQQARVDVARDQLLAARLTIEGNVVNAALDLAALEDEVAATRKTVSDQHQTLGLTRTRYQLGATSQFDVLTQESQLASSEAQLQQLQQARDVARHLLATYLGEFPSATGTLHAPALADLRLPATLPLSLPSTLVRERPDVLAAEAQLRAANAQVGEAVARMYPNLQLTGSFGDQSNHTGTLFDPASRLWNLAAGLVMPLFEGGTLRAQKHAAQAAYRGVFANYQGTVLGAFRNVADVLRALEHDSALLDAQARALRDARQASELVQTQYRAGGVDFLNVLASETQVQNARIAFVRAEAQRYADTAALYVALGGGEWMNASADAHGAVTDRR